MRKILYKEIHLSGFVMIMITVIVENAVIFLNIIGMGVIHYQKIKHAQNAENFPK